jgi:hypothetical protein
MTYRTDEDAAEARRLVEAARTRVRASVLDRVQTASPCAMAWNDMVGDDQVRHCPSCDKSVFNLSHMTREDAERLIAATDGKLCAQYYRRADGTILTADCAVGAGQARRRTLAVAGASLLIVAAGAVAYERTAVAAAEPDPAPQVGAFVTGGEPLATSVRAQAAEPPAPPAPPVERRAVQPAERHLYGAWHGGALLIKPDLF